jgi:hypothetical protein
VDDLYCELLLKKQWGQISGSVCLGTQPAVNLVATLYHHSTNHQ